jgi:hypothetical protein
MLAGKPEWLDIPELPEYRKHAACGNRYIDSPIIAETVDFGFFGIGGRSSVFFHFIDVTWNSLKA